MGSGLRVLGFRDLGLNVEDFVFSGSRKVTMVTISVTAKV